MNQKIRNNITIPLIDLNNDTERQTIVDRENGQYLGQVSSVILEDGKTIIAVYLKGHGRGAIVMKRSEDGGLTWSERLPVPATWHTSLEVPTIHRTSDSEGNKRLILFSGLYPARMSVSGDDGHSWSELEPIGDFGGIVTMGDVVHLENGRYAAFFHDDGRTLDGGDGTIKYMVYRLRKNDQIRTEVWYSRKNKQGEWEEPEADERSILNTDENRGEKELIYESILGDKHHLVNYPEKSDPKVYMCLSEDGGLHWEKPVAIARADSAYLCEPGAVWSPDRKELTLLMRENNRTKNSFFTSSKDMGKTWTTPRELPAALTGDRHTARYAPDGRLVVTFRDMADSSPTYGDWVAWIGTYDDIIEGREGQYRLRLKDNLVGGDCAYPGLTLQSDGSFTAITYGHWEKDVLPYILSLRFTLDDMDKKLKEQSR